MKGSLKARLIDICLFYAAGIWGATFFVVKRSLEDIDPVILVGYRFFIASAILLVYLLLKRKPVFKNIKSGFVLGSLLWLLYIPQTIGLVYTTASNSGFITGLYVAFVPIFSLILFRKKPSIKDTIAVFVSLTGLYVLTGGSTDVNIGDIITLITAMAAALHILFGDKFVKSDIDPYILSFQQFTFVSLFSFITGLVFRLPFSFELVSTFWIVLFLAMFPTLSAFVIMLVAQKTTSPLKISLIFALEPVFAALFAWTVGGEAFVPHRAMGGLLIVLAIVISTINFNTVFSLKSK